MNEHIDFSIVLGSINGGGYYYYLWNEGTLVLTWSIHQGTVIHITMNSLCSCLQQWKCFHSGCQLRTRFVCVCLLLLMFLMQLRSEETVSSFSRN